MFERSLEEQRIDHRALEFSSGNTLRGCLVRGLGLTYCPRISITKELEDELLQVLDWQLTTTSVLIIRHADKWCSPLLQRFMEITANRLQ